MEQVGFCGAVGRRHTYRSHLSEVFVSTLDGAEEDSAGPNGSSSEPWLRPACRRLHSQMSGETQHRYFSH